MTGGQRISNLALLHIMIILSFDCAYRSLAWAYIRFDDLGTAISTARCTAKSITAHRAAGGSDQPVEFPKIIELVSAGVADVLGEKIVAVDHAERARRLCQWLNKLSADNIRPDLVLIEHQPMKLGAANNAHSSVVQQQLLFYFIMADVAVKFIEPRQKNTVNLSLAAASMNVVGSGRYYDRKKHSVENMTVLAAAFGWQLPKISAKHKDDLADAIMQAVVYWAKTQ